MRKNEEMIKKVEGNREIKKMGELTRITERRMDDQGRAEDLTDG